MTTDLFSLNEPPEPSHPRLRLWQKWIANGQRAELTIYRDDADVGLIHSRMFVQFYEGDAERALEESDWDPVLNAGLLSLHIRAVDLSNEAERFALGLRDGFIAVEKEYGNGYFNAMLLTVIHESDLATDATISDVMKFTYRDRIAPSKTNEHCRNDIVSGISSRSRELRQALNYSPDDVKKIMTAAIARYLDERFSVSARKRFGLL